MKLIVCLITTLLYPLYNVNGFPKFPSWHFYRLFLLEGVFGVEIILNFFLQDLDEDGKSKGESLETVSSNYLRGKFLIDLIALLPLGAMFTHIDERFKVLWLVKAIRIKELHQYLSKKSFQPVINHYIQYKQGNAITDPDLCNEINEDLIYIGQKIYIRNVFKIVRLIL